MTYISIQYASMSRFKVVCMDDWMRVSTCMDGWMNA